jgi:hypothetical protein
MSEIARHKIIKRKEDITQWIMKGESNAYISKNIGVAIETYSSYCNLDEEIKAFVDDAKSYFVNEVEKSLKKLCLGTAMRTKMTTVIRKDMNGKILFTESKEEKIYYLPSEGAIKFLLCNMSPEKWKMIQEGAPNNDRQVVIVENPSSVDFSKLKDYKFHNDGDSIDSGKD